MSDDRTADMALLPGEREMPAEAWLEYGGLPQVLRGYCFRLMIQEADARVRLREAELEVAEWRDRTSRLLSRAEAAEQRAEALAAELAQARADARVLVGQMWAVDERFYTEDVLVPAGLTATEVDAVRDSYDHTLPVAEVVAVIRRALGGAA